MLLYSGHDGENDPQAQGEALKLSKNARKTLIRWETHGSRNSNASFETKVGIAINVIKCYAPTDNYNDDDKNQFHGRLQSIIAKCLGKDPT